MASTISHEILAEFSIRDEEYALVYEYEKLEMPGFFDELFLIKALRKSNGALTKTLLKGLHINVEFPFWFRASAGEDENTRTNEWWLDRVITETNDAIERRWQEMLAADEAPPEPPSDEEVRRREIIDYVKGNLSVTYTPEGKPVFGVAG